MRAKHGGRAPATPTTLLAPPPWPNYSYRATLSMSPANNAFSVKSLLNPEVLYTSAPLMPSPVSHPPRASNALPRMADFLTKSACRVPASQVYLARAPNGSTFMARYPDAGMSVPYQYSPHSYHPTPQSVIYPNRGQRMPIRPVVRPPIQSPVLPTSSISQTSSNSSLPESTRPQGSHARSPRLKHLHKLAERKRRSNLKYIFDDLSDLLYDVNGKSPGSKSEVVNTAIATIDKLRERLTELHKLKNSLT